MPLSRTAKWMIGVVAVLLVLPIAAVLLLLSLVPSPSQDEVSRVPSPDQRLEAVLVEVNGGATTSFGYEVYVVERAGKPKGYPAAYLYGAVRNESAYGANIRWDEPRRVAVEFLSAKVSRLKAPKVEVSDEEVTVAMLPGISDPEAPAGGMLYNLQGRK